MSLKAVKHLSFIFVLLLLLAGCRAQTPEVLVQKKTGIRFLFQLKSCGQKMNGTWASCTESLLKKIAACCLSLEKKKTIRSPRWPLENPPPVAGSNPPPSDSRTVVS